ncbi:MAG: 3-dehydroquinate synthase [Flavobacteriaceae bacterium]|nr:MAG: 3-dehydroquinate synthase [Flavobacteriaceae bacterium]
MQSIITDQYPIHFNETAYTELDLYLQKHNYSSVFILVDSNTHTHCLPVFLSNVKGLSNVEIIEITPGEDHKTIETVTQIWLSLSELGADRKSLLLNLGGGVVTDMGGFIASTFKRGIDFINIPTTLLSQVDASVGGKTGIDLEGMKNQIGTFAFPKMVLIDNHFLETLEKRELYSGFAEMLKHGLIANENHWEKLSELDSITIDSVKDLIGDSVEIKKEVTQADPTEKGLRKILNFGHTLGHAIESFYLETPTNRLLHGEAIAIGMVCETYLSFKLNLISKETLDDISRKILKFYSLPKLNPENYEAILDWLKHDKKNAAQKINFSLIDKIGSCLKVSTTNTKQDGDEFTRSRGFHERKGDETSTKAHN